MLQVRQQLLHSIAIRNTHTLLLRLDYLWIGIIMISSIVVVVESKNDLVLKPLLRNNNDWVAKRLCALEVELLSLSCVV